MSTCVETTTVAGEGRIPRHTPRSPVLAVARIEGLRLVRHPVFLAGALLSVLVAFELELQSDVGGRYFVLMGPVALPLALGTLIAVNLATLRSRRSSTGELYESLAAPARVRTLAHLLSVALAASVCLFLVAVAFVVYRAWEGLRVTRGGGIEIPGPLELAQAPIAVALVGALGVALALWLPYLAVAPLAAVGLFVFEMPFTTWNFQAGFVWFAPLVNSARTDPQSSWPCSLDQTWPCVLERFATDSGRLASPLPRGADHAALGAGAPAQRPAAALPPRGSSRSRPRRPRRSPPDPVTRGRQAMLLAAPFLRTVAWLALLPASALALGVLTFDGPLILQLRLAAASLCIGAAFVLDDAAAETLACSPTPLLFCRFVRLALVLPLVAASWGLLLWYAGAGGAWALTLELGAMLALTLAVAVVAAPFIPDRRGGVAAGPALLAFLGVAALALPGRWTLFAGGPLHPRWDDSHARWALVLAGAILAFLYASRDPGRPRLLSARPWRCREPFVPVDTTEPI